MIGTFRLPLLLSGGVCAIAAAAFADDAAFNRDIAPLIVKRCLECHNATEASGGLNLAVKDKALAGGDAGAVIVPGDIDGSSLIQRITAGEMPPEKNGVAQKLPDTEIEAFRKWIAAGAAWPDGRMLDPYEQSTEKRGGRDWWSFQLVQRPAVPAIPAATTVDAFIAEKLQAAGISPAPPADKRTLLRRITNDLIGLPPTAEETAAFLADDSPDAYERTVERLLASPLYGERWARYWLDVVRFAETNGYERDAVKANAWRYRDWVIDAFNSDKPYDRFIQEQLAGDELPDRSESTVIATGMLRLGTWDDEPNDVDEYQYDRLEDLVHATSTAFLGLTIKCARCHDHKFDPIPQTDYFRVAAAFWAGPIRHRARELAGGPTKDELGYEVLGWTDITREPAPLHLLKKGSIHRPGDAVPPGSPTFTPVLARLSDPPPAEAKTSQRRLQLARWIADPQHPLTARVFVNRLWQHHFGEGLVGTPDNFGFLGNKPSHPALLDWLATEFVRSGWSIKHMHRLLVTSDAYKQSSLHPQHLTYEEQDAANRLLWRANRQRLDAESIRDALLATCGRLDLRIGGPSFYAPISEEALEGLSMKSGAYKPSPVEDSYRRSVYMFTKRGIAVPLMTTFDACDNTAPVGRRDVTTVPTQALALLNNAWVHEQSRTFAERVTTARESSTDRIDLAWTLALGRGPTEAERTAALAHVQAYQSSAADDALAPWTSLCHVLINSNEFIYVD
jgi:hypothetical protein